MDFSKLNIKTNDKLIAIRHNISAARSKLGKSHFVKDKENNKIRVVAVLEFSGEENYGDIYVLDYNDISKVYKIDISTIRSNDMIIVEESFMINYQSFGEFDLNGNPLISIWSVDKSKNTMFANYFRVYRGPFNIKTPLE